MFNIHSSKTIIRRKRIMSGTAYLTVADTVKYLNISERFVRRLIAERRIAFYRVGRHVRLATADLNAWLATSRAEPFDRRHIRRQVLKEVS